MLLGNRDESSSETRTRTNGAGIYLLPLNSSGLVSGAEPADGETRTNRARPMSSFWVQAPGWRPFQEGKTYSQ